MISERALRAVLVLLGIYHVATGGLALVAPDTFFDEIGKYGTENSHYVGDVGAFTIAFGFALLAAVRWPSWRVGALGLGALWYGFHALNHAFDVGEARSNARGVGDTVALGLGALFAAYLAWVAARLGRSAAGPAARGRR